jgi:hypothetical protein
MARVFLVLIFNSLRSLPVPLEMFPQGGNAEVVPRQGKEAPPCAHHPIYRASRGFIGGQQEDTGSC